MTENINLLNADDSLLLIVDIQSKLTAVMPEEAAENMLKNTVGLVKAAEQLNIPVFLTEQYPKGLGSTVDGLKQQLSHHITCFEKTNFSCLGAENFTDTLANSKRKQIILVGQETHVCILQTAFELIEQGYQVHVLEDAVCSRKAENKFYALQRMQQKGATISHFESVLFEWLRNAQHQHFSDISQLLH